PAHIHFMIYKPGFKTQFAQVYSHDDPNLETDVQFGVTQALVGQYVLHEGEATPDGQQPERWYALSHRFIIEPGEATLPKPPITGKATGPKPELAILKREAR
ncbi:MAG: catechol 1,2-dioxygenase, partial [Pigmentiphaga sp.]